MGCEEDLGIFHREIGGKIRRYVEYMILFCF